MPPCVSQPTVVASHHHQHDHTTNTTTTAHHKTSHLKSSRSSTPSGRCTGFKWDDLSEGEGKENMTYRKLWDAATGVKSGQCMKSMEEKIATME